MTHQRICTVLLVATVSVLWALGGSAPAVLAGEGGCPEPGIDTDFDGVCDDVDNCPTFPNADQADADENGVGDPCEDTDGDGVIDGLDVCPDSDQSETEVMIGKCSTGVINHMTPSGCSFIDAINACEAGATSHGRFVRCVALRAVVWIRSGMIARRSLGRIVRCAARANIPPRK